MPLDGTELAPTLQMLSTILRDRTLWPKDFEWDFNNCATCAMGLLMRSLHKKPFFIGSDFREMFNLSAEQFEIFNSRNFYEKHPSKITPDDVADAIDKYLIAPYDWSWSCQEPPSKD